MKNGNFNSHYQVDTGAVKIKVYKIGSSPRLTKRSANAADPTIMKGIHTHFTYEAFFVTDGSLELVTEESSRIFERGIFIIPPKLRHYTYLLSGESYCFLFSVEGKSVAATRLRTVLDGDVCTLPISSGIEHYIRTVAEKCNLSTHSAQRDSALLFSLIFSEIADSLTGASETRDSTSASEHISEIEEYLNTNLQNKITLSTTASAIHLSSKQVSRIIEREYGCTFLELLTDKRLASAEMLLKNSDMKISDIAASTFIGSETYFYTVFKKKYGTTPLKYRIEYNSTVLEREKAEM